MLKRKLILLLLCFPILALSAETNLEDHFNLCLEFGAPIEVVRLYHPLQTYLQTYKEETNSSISYVMWEDRSLLQDSPYTEYQIWYTIDQEHGLYQSSLVIRADKAILQNILTGYLRKFSELYGVPVYTNLDNGCLLIFWYDEDSFTVKARLILDIINSHDFVSIAHCSPMPVHAPLLRSLYNFSALETP